MKLTPKLRSRVREVHAAACRARYHTVRVECLRELEHPDAFIIGGAERTQDGYTVNVSLNPERFPMLRLEQA